MSRKSRYTSTLTTNGFVVEWSEGSSIVEAAVSQNGQYVEFKMSSDQARSVAEALLEASGVVR